MVERTRIHLADARENIGETEELGDPSFQFRQSRGVPVEQVEHVLRGAHRALDAPQRIAVDQFAYALQRDQALFGGRREALAQRRGLSRHIVRTSGHHEIPVDDGPLGEPGHHRDAVREHQLERLADLQLLDVLGEVAARHALVHVLVAGQRVEFLDAGLDVVAGHALTRGDGRGSTSSSTRS